MSHYSLAQKPKDLLKWAEAIAIDIYVREIKYPVLVYRGMSGISAATALSLQLHILGVEHGMVYIRKENEKSHGNDVEKEIDRSKHHDFKFIFVDDFVASGETKRECINKIIDEVCSWWPKGKVEFDYCAVQECSVPYCEKVYTLADHTGENLCKN